MCICSLDDDTFMRMTNVVTKDFVSQDFPLQEYDTTFDVENLGMEEKGFVENAKGRLQTMFYLYVYVHFCLLNHGLCLI